MPRVRVKMELWRSAMLERSVMLGRQAAGERLAAMARVVVEAHAHSSLVRH